MVLATAHPAAIMSRVAMGGVGTAAPASVPMPLRQAAGLAGVKARDAAAEKKALEAPEIDAILNGADPSTTEKVLQGAEGLGWKAINMEFFPALAAMGLGSVVKGADWLRGKKVPFTDVKLFPGALSTEKPGWFSKAASALHVPSRVMQSTTLGELGSPSTLKSNIAQAWKDRGMTAADFENTKDARLAEVAKGTEALLKAGEGAPGKGGLRFATTHATTLGNSVQRGVNTANRWMGHPLTRMQAMAQNRAGTLLVEKAAPAVGELEKMLHNPLLRQHLPAEALQEAHGAIHGLRPLLSRNTSALAATRVAEGGQAVNSAMEGLRRAAGEVKNLPDGFHAALKAAEKQAATVAKQTAKAGKWFGRFDGWRGIGSAIANAPKALRAMPVSHGLMGAAFLAGGAAQLAGTLHHRSQDKAGLSRLEADMAGLPEGPLKQEMAEKVHDAAKGSLRHAMLKGAVDVGTTALSLRMVRGGLSAMLPLMGLQMIGGTAADTLTSRDNLPHVYDFLSKAHEKGQRLTPAHYASLVSMALPKHLDHIKTDNATLQAVVEQYSTAQMSPKQVLADIASGQFDTRAAAAKQAHEQAAKAAAKVPAPGTVVGTHTQALAARNGTLPAAKLPEAVAPATVVPGAQVAAMAHEGTLGHAAGLAVGA